MDAEHSHDEHALNSLQNPAPTAVLCLLPSSPPAAATSLNPEPTAALRISAPPQAAAAAPVTAAAEKTTPMAEAAATEHERGKLALWKEQRRLSVERSVRTIAGMLLQAGADIDTADNEGNTSLLTAASTAGVALCELLLARGANADARWELYALRVVVQTGKLVLNFSLAKGCPLHYLSLSEHVISRGYAHPVPNKPSVNKEAPIVE